MRTVVVLAAGNGSRYGGPKQYAQFGPLNLTLMQYNLYHAISAGYERAVIVIQDKHYAMAQPIKKHLSEFLDVEICIQSLEDLPEGCRLPENQTKPLGTAHALWCVRKYIKGNMTVINADDYYGAAAFQLTSNVDQNQAALVAYQLKNTLSEHGGVNRGLCSIASNSELISIEEVTNITYQCDGICGQRAEDLSSAHLQENDLTSMNFWVLPQNMFSVIEEKLLNTLTKDHSAPIEIYLPDVVAHYIKQHDQSVKVLTSLEPWFGVTYEADATNVNHCLTTLTQSGKFSLFQVKPS